MRSLLAALILCFASPAFAQDSQKIDRLTAESLATLKFADLQWVDAPALNKGAKLSVLTGDPGKAGVFMLYLKLPSNFTIAPHRHPFTEVVTVIKGQISNALGEEFDRDKGDLLDAGSSFVLPANQAHYLWNDEETILLLTATGPFGVEYVNPSDDPRNN